MMANIEELQYGECCCCLEKGDHRELAKQYCLNEQPEIYEVLFKDTFDIVLKYPENTKLICDCCIAELRQANHFRFMVESSQQSLSDRVNWQPEFVNVEENPLGPLNTEIFIKCDPDNQMVKADNDVEQSEHTMEEPNNDAEETDMKEKTVAEEPLQQIVISSIKHESDDDMEVVPIADHVNIQDNSDSSTSSSDTLANRRHKGKILKVLLTRSSIVEQLHSYTDSNRPNKSAVKNNLTTQMRTHTRDKPFSCYICQYKTANKGDITRHIRIHTGEKPFSCYICQHKSAIKGDITRHMRIHTGEKPFSCDICQYKAAHRGNLNVHKRIHMNEKRFSCNICQYKAVRNTQISSHMRTHTREKRFSCDICQYRTAFTTALAKHIAKVHLRNML